MKSFKLMIPFCIVISIATALTSADYRNIDGTYNNIENPSWGSTQSQLQRMIDPAYEDGVSTLAGENRPNPRDISNIVLDQSEPIYNGYGRSDYLWAWGQFLDHDISLTHEAYPTEEMYIDIPANDEHFDPDSYFTMARATWDKSTGTDISNPRQQLNTITSWIDGSVVYGSDPERAAWLRTGENGKLKTSAHTSGDLLPYNDGTVNNAGGKGTEFFVAGDVRANEHVVLSSMQTLFLREHNRLAEKLKTENPTWNDETIYQHAKKIVGAEIQAITYNEFLPTLLGGGAIDEYSGYDSTVNPAISNMFSTASYRIGHTMVSSTILRLDENNDPVPEGPLQLKDAFFNPEMITEYGGIEPILRGLSYQQHQKIDGKIVDDLRNSLFSSFDLASFNIQRGRDHGLADYNTVREYYNLAPAMTFADITKDIELQNALKLAYGTTDDIDPWVGMIAEDHMPNQRVGELNYYMIKEQFEYLRNSDRYWYQIDPDMLEYQPWLDNISLSQIIAYNTGITNLPNNNIFNAVPVPTSIALTITGLIALRLKKRRKIE